MPHPAKLSIRSVHSVPSVVKSLSSSLLSFRDGRFAYNCAWSSNTRTRAVSASERREFGNPKAGYVCGVSRINSSQC